MGLSPSDPRVVHHKNGNKHDNRKSNLQVVSRAEHCKIDPNALQYTDCIPGYEVTLTPAGVAEYLDDEHYQLESWEKLSDNAYCMTLKTVKSGERQMYYYTMIGDLLYEEMKYENTKYLPPEIIVYRK